MKNKKIIFEFIKKMRKSENKEIILNILINNYSNTIMQNKNKQLEKVAQILMEGIK